MMDRHGSAAGNPIFPECHPLADEKREMCASKGKPSGCERPDKGLDQRMMRAAPGRALGPEQRVDEKWINGQFDAADFAIEVETGEPESG